MSNWYNLPTYYDVSFSHEMHDELAFLKAILINEFSGKQPRLLEPACGTGRLLIPLSRAGYKCTGFDINENALRYLQEKLNRNKLQATIFKANMINFSVKDARFDVAYCTVDTFRHLLTESDALQHLTKLANVLNKGGMYIVGLHLLPKQGITNKISRWTAKRGRLTVKTSMTLIDQSKTRRTETLRVVLKIGNENKYVVDKNQFESIYNLRTYTLSQFNRLIAKTNMFEVLSVYDHSYDLSCPVVLNERSDYGVFVLKKIK